MKAHYLIFLLAFLVACVSDPQDIPPGMNNNPVFFSDLTVGQQTFRLTAGENGYAMRTEHYVDGEGVTRYIATLASETCQPSPCPSLEIEFFDNQVLAHPESGVAYTFLNGSKSFYSAEEDGLLDITWLLVQDGFGPSVSFWTTSGDSMPLTSSEIHLTAKPHEFVDLCFHRFGNSDCNGFASYCFYSLASSPFIGLLKADKTYNDHLLVEMDLNQGNPPYTYNWMNGATTPFILVPLIEGEEFGVGVTVTDVTGSRIEVSQTIRIQGGIAEMCGGTPQFISTISKAPFTQFATAIVRFTDSNGMQYSSAFGTQANSLFDILSVADFANSPEGFATKQLELAINGILYSEDGSQSVQFETENTMMAVSYER